MANPLARDLGVPAYGYSAGPEFDPDLRLEDGGQVAVGTARIEVIHTPGHSDDHLCFRAEDVLFTGDHIMGGSSVMVETMGPYLDSLEKIRGTGLRRLHPGHGEEMGDPELVIDWYLAHRLQRHEEIYEAIKAGASRPTGHRRNRLQRRRHPFAGLGPAVGRCPPHFAHRAGPDSL